MGCQASRFDEEGEDGQPPRSGLFRRFDEATRLRKTDRVGKSAVSQKQLLEEGAGDDNDDDDESGSTAHHTTSKIVEDRRLRDNQEDGGGFSDREDHQFGPRSPSFREYCSNNSGELDKDYGQGNGPRREKKRSQRREKTATSNSNEGSKPKSPKKRRSFRMVLPKYGPRRSFWSVSSCYNPSDDDRPRKEHGKAS